MGMRCMFSFRGIVPAGWLLLVGSVGDMRTTARCRLLAGRACTSTIVHGGLTANTNVCPEIYMRAHIGIDHREDTIVYALQCKQ